MALRFPPPPDLGRDNQKLNRWLLEIQSILNNEGFIDPSEVAGLPEFITQTINSITALDSEVADLSNEVAELNDEIAALQNDVTALQSSVATLQGQVAALQARNQILNGVGPPIGALGSDGDLYINNTGAPGSNLYAKIAGAWAAFA